MEAQAADRAEGPAGPARQSRAEGAGGVLDDRHTERLSDRFYLGRHTKLVNRDRCARLRGAARGKISSRSVPGGRIDVDERRCRARHPHGVGRAGPGQCRNQHFIARGDLENCERQLERARAARGGDAMPPLAEVGDPALEFANTLALHEHARGEHFGCRRSLFLSK